MDIEEIIKDTEIPSGFGGINQEGYTYGQLRRNPIIPEILKKITVPKVKEWANQCNERNKDGFIMIKKDGEYCFEDLRVGPKVKLPDVNELKGIIQGVLTSKSIRQVSYNLLREEIARQSNIDMSNAVLVIGNMLDCVPHEDISGYVFMVPNWAHKRFSHRGYVHKILNQIKNSQ